MQKILSLLVAVFTLMACEEQGLSLSETKKEINAVCQITCGGWTGEAAECYASCDQGGSSGGTGGTGGIGIGGGGGIFSDPLSTGGAAVTKECAQRYCTTGVPWCREHGAAGKYEWHRQDILAANPVCGPYWTSPVIVQWWVEGLTLEDCQTHHEAPCNIPGSPNRHVTRNFSEVRDDASCPVTCEKGHWFCQDLGGDAVWSRHDPVTDCHQEDGIAWVSGRDEGVACADSAPPADVACGADNPPYTTQLVMPQADI